MAAGLITVVILSASEGSASVPASEAPRRPAIAKTPHVPDSWKEFSKTYCVRCHGPNKAKGKIRLDTLTTSITTEKEYRLWENVLRQVEGGDMPPEDELRPKAAVLSTLTARVDGFLAKARESGLQEVEIELATVTGTVTISRISVTRTS